MPIKTTVGTLQNGLNGQVVLVSSLVSCIHVYVGTFLFGPNRQVGRSIQVPALTSSSVYIYIYIYIYMDVRKKSSSMHLLSLLVQPDKDFQSFDPFKFHPGCT